MNEPSHCDPNGFKAAAAQYKKLYVLIQPEQSECPACQELDGLISRADIKTPIVKVPGDTCSAIADELGVGQYPTVVLMRGGKAVKTHKGIPNSEIVKRMVAGK